MLIIYVTATDFTDERFTKSFDPMTLEDFILTYPLPIRSFLWQSNHFNMSFST